DRAILRMIERTFADSKIEVLTAKTAEDGIALVRAGSPDVVLLDVYLPGAHGLGVYQEIQAIDRRLPVVFITQDGKSDTAIEAMSLGAYDYLLKPLNLVHVREVVERALKIR